MLSLQPHLRAVSDRAKERTDGLAASLCNELGRYLRIIGDYPGARPYYERALAIRERVLGPDHPTTQVVRQNLTALKKGRKRKKVES